MFIQRKEIRLIEESLIYESTIDAIKKTLITNIPLKLEIEPSISKKFVYPEKQDKPLKKINQNSILNTIDQLLNTHTKSHQVSEPKNLVEAYTDSFLNFKTLRSDFWNVYFSYWRRRIIYY